MTASKRTTPAKKRVARKPKPAPAPPAVDLAALGARVVSIFGPFNSRVLIELRSDVAATMFPDGDLAGARRSQVIDAIERDVGALKERDEALAGSALAATAVALAYELEHPYNSATSKSMCARALMEAMDKLRALAPPERARDGIDDIAADLAAGRAAAGVAGPPDLSRP